MRQIRNILAVRNDRLGEFLLTIPALTALKRGFPGALLTLVVNPANIELAEMIKCVDRVISWENREHRLPEIFHFARSFKGEGIDLCVIFNPSKEFNIISFLAGIPLRVGYGRKWPFLLNRKIPDKKNLGERHEVEYNLDLARLAGAGVRDAELSLDVGVAGKKEKGLIAIHPWTSDPVKQWPQANFVQLAKVLARELNQHVIIIGGQAEQDKSSRYFSELGENIEDHSGKTSLKELSALLKQCQLLISGDSGPVHLAAAVGTEVIAIFRNDLPGKGPKRWGPWGNGHSVIERPSLSEISVNEVLNKVKEKLRI